MTLDRTATAVVVGGGIVGASAAYHLAAAGVATTLVDAACPGQATAAGAGIIAPSTSVRADAAHTAFAVRAAECYPRLVAALAEHGETRTGHEVVGELFHARDDEEAARLPALVEQWRARAVDGWPNLGTVTPVDGDEAARMFPPLARVPAAIHVEGAARVDGALLRDALVGAARTLGATVRHGRAALDADGRVSVDGAELGADAVVVAAGAWSAELLAPLGVVLAVEPQRGQIAHLALPGHDTTRWPVVLGFRDQYLLTFGPDRVVAGASRETGSGFDPRLTAGGTRSVLDAALATAPGLAAATVTQWRVGLRPASADGLPHLGPCPGAPHVVVAAGHGPSGLTTGPWSGLAAARLVTGDLDAADPALASTRVGR